MARKTADLRMAMRSTANPAHPAQPEPAPTSESSTIDRGSRAPHFRPGRAGKSNVTGYFPPEVKKQLRILAAEQETTIQELLAETLNDLFAKYGKPEIAPVQVAEQ